MRTVPMYYRIAVDPCVGPLVFGGVGREGMLRWCVVICASVGVVVVPCPSKCVFSRRESSALVWWNDCCGQHAVGSVFLRALFGNFDVVNVWAP